MIDQIKKLCRQYDIHPARNKGQHFLADRAVLDTIMSVAGLTSTDTVLEVGPGLGILTESLARAAGRVVSVEIDEKLYQFLKMKFTGTDTVSLIRDDILRLNRAAASLSTYCVVANLPYNITSHFLKLFLTQAPKPTRMVLLIQREVAERICATPGQMSVLTVSVQLYGQPQVRAIVVPASFWPAPAVDSAIIVIDGIQSAEQVAEQLKPVTEKEFWRVVKVGFAARRKTLVNNLVAGIPLQSAVATEFVISCGLATTTRAQELSVSQWTQLAKMIKNHRN